MKTYFSFKIVLTIGLFSLLLFTSCQTEQVIEPDPSAVFPTTAQPLGKSYSEWAIQLGKEFSALNCENILKNQLLDLGNNVLAPSGILGDSEEEEYTISREDYIFFSPAYYINDYPCPEEFEFEPAEGQTLEDFLKEGAKNIIDPIMNLQIFLDGEEIQQIDNYRLSTDLFYFTGNPELAECFDPCITGEPQPAVIDGYYMMFKNLKVGKHVVKYSGDIPSEDYTFEITMVLNVI